ncbi:hypothetical protein TH6_14535 [Thalassospira profundimaris]|uniref:YjiS-like domain-containing protein n=2 Tax=Thalassospiraceae TaxID=2844866 RepID=A0A367V775_9PROT|nr:hypothetical protein TH6_14535 [Thalassospira profundimaris]
MERMMAYSLSPAPSAVERQSRAHIRSFFATVFGRLNDFNNRFERLRAARKERCTLLSLSDHLLSDIGITRAQAEEEYRKSLRLR